MSQPSLTGMPNHPTTGEPPPTPLAHKGVGEYAPTESELLNAAKLVMDNCGIAFRPHKVTRMIHAFRRRAPHGSGYLFFEYLSSQLGLSADQKRKSLAHLNKVLTYADPTGETAVHNVLREQNAGAAHAACDNRISTITQ